MTETIPKSGSPKGLLAAFVERDKRTDHRAVAQMREELLRPAQFEAIKKAEQRLYAPRIKDGLVLVPVQGDPSRVIRITRSLHALARERGLQGSRWMIDEFGAIRARMRSGNRRVDPDAWFDVVATIADLNDGDRYTLKSRYLITTTSVTVTKRAC